jgi:hypothetical protein
VFLSCVFINFIYVFLTSGQDCNSGKQKRIHFRADLEHNVCRPVSYSDVSLGYQFCKSETFILYIIYNIRYNNIISNKLQYSLLVVHWVLATVPPWLKPTEHVPGWLLENKYSIIFLFSLFIMFCLCEFHIMISLYF